jgi:pimeloyl-ACP methyl ester carboxylesterase
LNSVIGSHNDSSIEKHLRETKQISYFNVNGLDVMYRCVVREGVVPTRTVWIVHGVSASWLIQSPPTHFLHEQLRDAQVCSYARPGRGFTSQSTDDFTVDAIVEQLRSLIVGVTPQTHTIILVGHS